MNKPKKERTLIQVNTRLFRDDIDEIKRRAAQVLLPWQIVLRMVLHEALKHKGKVV